MTANVRHILAIEDFLGYLASERAELSDDPAAAEAIDREHRRLDEERMRLKMGLTVGEDELLESTRQASNVS